MSDLELDEKRESILAHDGHLLIEGGPGCGKTTIALLKADQVQRELVSEAHVLFLSFSRAAVRQVVERSEDLLTGGARHSVEVRTFHSFFIDVVLAHGRLVTKFPPSVIGPDQERRMRSSAGDSWQLELDALRAGGALLFSDLASTVATLFEAIPEVLHLYASRYPWVFVDEFQDTDEDQWRVIRALAQFSTVVCLADPDQRIFEHLPGVDESRLPTLVECLRPLVVDLSADNHRSPNSGILRYANDVLKNLPTVLPDEVRVLQYGGYTPDAEVHREVHRLRQTGIGTVAVLTRSNAAAVSSSEAISSVRAQPGQEDLPPIDHKLHWDPALAAAAATVVASILEWPLLEQSQALSGTVQRIADYFRIKHSGGVNGAAAIAAKAERALEALTAGKRPRSSLASTLVDKLNFVERYSGTPAVDWQVALALLEPSAELREIQKQARLVRLLSPADSLFWVLNDAWSGVNGYRDASRLVSEFFADDTLMEFDLWEPDVNVMTMHKSKGKEFDAVVIVEGRFGRPLLSEVKSEEQGDRRLLRVAITRARRMVTFVRPIGAAELTTS